MKCRKRRARPCFLVTYQYGSAVHGTATEFASAHAAHKAGRELIDSGEIARYTVARIVSRMKRGAVPVSA